MNHGIDYQAMFVLNVSALRDSIDTEIILVDNGSTDLTQQVLSQAKKEKRRIRLKSIRIEKNERLLLVRKVLHV